MLTEEQVDAYCPYCGEPILLLVDCSVERQEYIEDCEVCCRPIVVETSISEDGEPRVWLRAENE
jgi:hypothetical protein